MTLKCGGLQANKPRSRLLAVIGLSIAAVLSSSCQSRRFNASGVKSDRVPLTPETFRGVLFQVKPMPIWATFDYANSALKWVFSKPDFKDFVAEEWVAKPYGSYRFDYLIQPRGSWATAYKGSDFDTDMRALALALEANFKYASGNVTFEDGVEIEGKAAAKVQIVLNDGLDHGEPDYARGVPLPWAPSLKVGTDDPEWSRTFVRVPEAWRHLEERGKKPGEGVTIGVIDTGVLPHPVLWGASQAPTKLDVRRAATFESTDRPLIERISAHFREDWKEEPWTRRPALDFNQFKAVDIYSFNAAPANPGHGTAVVSILSGVGNEVYVEKDNPKTYVNGIVPFADIVPVRVGSSTVFLDTAPMAKAIRHLTENGANVITVSLGGVPGVDMHEALIEAYKKGVIFTAAAGNGLPFVVWPAAYKEAIAVGAGNVFCQAWEKSSPGTKVEILAPGEDVWYAASFFDKRHYELKKDLASSEALHYAVKRGKGTSFATPHVAAAAALWLSKYGVEEIKAHYRKQLGKHNDDRYVSLAFRYIMSRPYGHTACPGGDGSRMRRDAGGAYLNTLGLLGLPLESFPTKSRLDDFEVGELREQQSYDLALTGLSTIALGAVNVLTQRDTHDGDLGLLPPGVRSQLVSIFKEKVRDARAGKP